MGLRQCEKCEEMVDEARAFCPGCGHAFVAEEKRSKASNFDTADSTVQLGQTMYNQMLSDMGLNISKAPDPVEKRIEVISPVAIPAATEVRPPAAKLPVEAKKPGSNKKWIIAAVSVVALFVLLAIAIAAIFFIYWYQFR